MVSPRPFPALFGVLGIALAAAAVAASVEVIFDSGRTVSIAPYFQALEPSEDVQGVMPPTPAPPTAPLEALLPIETPEMSPGVVQARSVRLPPLVRPLFLMGADERSLGWLAAQRERLRALGAIGLVVQVRSADELHAVGAAAGGLTVIPISGSDIAKALALSHYPVLIARDRIEQ